MVTSKSVHWLPFTLFMTIKIALSTGSAILILAIRTLKFGGRYMPVILRERLVVLKQVRGLPPQNDIL
jgi:hypothetical protein